MSHENEQERSLARNGSFTSDPAATVNYGMLSPWDAEKIPQNTARGIMIERGMRLKGQVGVSESRALRAHAVREFRDGYTEMLDIRDGSQRPEVWDKVHRLIEESADEFAGDVVGIVTEVTREIGRATTASIDPGPEPRPEPRRRRIWER